MQRFQRPNFHRAFQYRQKVWINILSSIISRECLLWCKNKYLSFFYINSKLPIRKHHNRRTLRLNYQRNKRHSLSIDDLTTCQLFFSPKKIATTNDRSFQNYHVFNFYMPCAFKWNTPTICVNVQKMVRKLQFVLHSLITIEIYVL